MTKKKEKEKLLRVGKFYAEKRMLELGNKGKKETIL